MQSDCTMIYWAITIDWFVRWATTRTPYLWSSAWGSHNWLIWWVIKKLHKPSMMPAGSISMSTLMPNSHFLEQWRRTKTNRQTFTLFHFIIMLTSSIVVIGITWRIHAEMIFSSKFSIILMPTTANDLNVVDISFESLKFSWFVKNGEFNKSNRRLRWKMLNTWKNEKKNSCKKNFKIRKKVRWFFWFISCQFSTDNGKKGSSRKPFL